MTHALQTLPNLLTYFTPVTAGYLKGCLKGKRIYSQPHITDAATVLSCLLDVSVGWDGDMNAEECASAIEAMLEFDPKTEIERICSFIQSEVNRRGVRGVVLGLSGGLDSTTCAYLCKRCLRPEQIHLFSLPERDSSAEILDRAHLAACSLNLPLTTEALSELCKEIGIYREMPQEMAKDRKVLERAVRIMRRISGTDAFFSWAQTYAFDSRHGLFACFMRRWLWPYAGRTEAFILGKVRARMLVLSMKAAQMDCLQICTTDRSEMTVGFYDPHGDGVGDIAPLCHLYKTQIRRLAGMLGVPEEILLQPSSGDLAAGLPNEAAIGLRYEKLDRVLAGFALGLKDEEIAAGAGLRMQVVKEIQSACKAADCRRAMPVKISEPK